MLVWFLIWAEKTLCWGFQDFLGKTSRIIERALDNQFDVIGDFFADDEEEQLFWCIICSTISNLDGVHCYYIIDALQL